MRFPKDSGHIPPTTLLDHYGLPQNNLHQKTDKVNHLHTANFFNR